MSKSKAKAADSGMTTLDAGGDVNADEGVITMEAAGIAPVDDIDITRQRLAHSDGEDSLDGEPVTLKPEETVADTPEPLNEDAPDGEDAATDDQPDEDGQEPTQKGWDKDRQKANEEAARLRKENEELKARLAGKSVEDVEAVDFEAPDATDDEPGEEDADDALVELTPPSELADEEEIAAYYAGLAKNQSIILKRQQRMEARIAKAEGRKALTTLAARQAQAIDGKAWRELVPEISSRFQRELKERGYSKSKLPTPETSRVLIELVAAQIRAERASKTGPKKTGSEPGARSASTTQRKSRPNGFATEAEAMAAVRQRIRERQSGRKTR